MKLSRSSFYHKLKDKGQEDMQQEADLRSKIEIICLEYPRYHCGRVTDQLKLEELRVNHKNVLRLIKESDLLCRIRRRRISADSDHRFPRYPNLINGMAITRRNQVRLSDIINIRIRIGFLCLAAILDVYSRKVTGYALSSGLDTSLTLEALKTAIDRRRTGLGVIHYSDHGVQYTLSKCVDELKGHGFLISMARWQSV